MADRRPDDNERKPQEKKKSGCPCAAKKEMTKTERDGNKNVNTPPRESPTGNSPDKIQRRNG